MKGTVVSEGIFIYQSCIGEKGILEYLVEIELNDRIEHKYPDHQADEEKSKQKNGGVCFLIIRFESIREARRKGLRK